MDAGTSREEEVERILASLEKEEPKVQVQVHGWVAARLGRFRSLNPYKGSEFEEAWNQGWDGYHKKHKHDIHGNDLCERHSRQESESSSGQAAE